MGDARAIGYLRKRHTNKDWKQPKRKKYIAVNKDESIWRSEDHFDISHGDAEVGVCPACILSHFDPVYSHYVPFFE